MTFRKTLKLTAWTFGGLAGLFVFAYAALAVWSWSVDERYETVLVIENLGGQPVLNLTIAHNGGTVYQRQRFDSHEIFALSNLNPIRGPTAHIPDGDIGMAKSKISIAFQRESDGLEDRIGFETDWHYRYGKKCLLMASITPRSIEHRKCVWMSKPEWQAKPKK
jgi:hypothetical protein